MLLTSGTTGTPKGAPRPEPRSLVLPGLAAGADADARPRGERRSAPPLYHGTGLIIALLSISLGSKIVLRQAFDAAQFLDDIERHRATSVVRRADHAPAGPRARRGRDPQGATCQSLRVVFCAGSQLPAEVASEATELLGDVIYNLYGSTEVSVATLATPEDVRAAPSSVGKPALGSTVQDPRRPAATSCPQGQTGRIFVGTLSPFEGYTGGGTKEIIDGLMSTGDVGHFDARRPPLHRRP